MLLIQWVTSTLSTVTDFDRLNQANIIHMLVNFFVAVLGGISVQHFRPVTFFV